MTLRFGLIRIRNKQHIKRNAKGNIQVTLGEDLYMKVSNLAVENGISRGKLVKQMIEFALKDMERHIGRDETR